MNRFRLPFAIGCNSARWLAFLLVLVAITAAYANHFHNDFHFDDFHTITDNPAIRSLRNVPLFFRDATTFSILPSHASYRPLVSASLAFDYWMGGGLQPLSFHVSTFIWFLALIGLIYVLAERVFDGRRWLALFAAALYGLHPVSAETVNYIVQRGDLYATLGVVAGVVTYAAFPALRAWGLYLLPALAGMLGKPSALVFAPILLAYIALCERDAEESLISCARRSVPAFILSLSYWVFQNAMSPATFSGASSVPIQYWITQPFVTWRYFRSFFLPLYLSADTDLMPFTSFGHAAVVAGFLFVLLLGIAAILAAREARWRPVAFGLVWFFVGLIPTAVIPFAEVENDHRMFLPFVGLTLSVVWMLHTLLATRVPRFALAAAAGAVLVAFGWGTHERNEVWRTEETLWRDVTSKSPRNGRGWMNFGLTQLQKGRAAEAYEYFERARLFTPNYSLLEINLGVAAGELGRDAEAEQHFLRAIQLDPQASQAYSFYGRWLNQRARDTEATVNLKHALSLNPADPVARQMAAFQSPKSAEDYLNQSLAYYQRGRYEDCVKAALEALRLRPDYAEAYNNIAAGYQSLGRWDEAMAAAEKAIRLKPGFELARNNLSYERAQKMLRASR